MLTVSGAGWWPLHYRDHRFISLWGEK